MNVSPASAFAVFSQVSATSGFALESSPITVAFNAPTFVSNVEIDGTDTIPAKVSVRYMNQSGQWKEATPIFRNAYGGYFSSVGSLASRIEIYRSSRSKTVRLAKVRVLGFSGFGTPAWGESYRAFVRLVDECRTSISEDYDKLVSERNEVEARKSELATVQAQWSQDIAGLKAERTKLAGEIAQAHADKVAADTKLAETKAELEVSAAAAQALSVKNAEGEAKSAALEKSLQENEEYQEALLKELSEKKANLTQINRDTDAVAQNLPQYNSQRKSQARWYFWFAVCCGVAAIGVSGLSFWQMWDIWNDVKSNSNLTWQIILVARGPMFTVFSASIYGLYELGTVCVRRVVQLDDRVLRMSEISVLMGDLHGAMPYPPNATDEQKREIFFGIRMHAFRNLFSGTFDVLRKAPKKEKEELLGSLKADDLAQLAKLAKELTSSKG